MTRAHKKKKKQLSQIFGILPSELRGDIIIAKKCPNRHGYLRVGIHPKPTFVMIEYLKTIGVQPAMRHKLFWLTLPAPDNIDENADIDIT